MKKDDIIELTIEDLGIDGEGIGKADGMAIFVKDAVVGDRIQAKIMKMKKHYGYARLMEVLEPSPVRCAPRCNFARQCGGCQLQAMTYEAQLNFKAKKVWNHLTRIGGLTDLEVPEIMGMEEPWCGYPASGDGPEWRRPMQHLRSDLFRPPAHRRAPGNWYPFPLRS